MNQYNIKKEMTRMIKIRYRSSMKINLLNLSNQNMIIIRVNSKTINKCMQLQIKKTKIQLDKKNILQKNQKQTILLTKKMRV